MQPVPNLKPARNQGAVLMAVLALVMVACIAATAMICVTGARLQQSERTATAVQRRLAWMNTEAVNRQYGYVFGFRDTVTRSSSSASLATNWGGLTAAAYSNLSAFESTQRPSAQVQTYPFNNVRVPPTADSGYFYERTMADSNSNQLEHVTMFNYLKTYPPHLQGDLLVLHKRPTAATGDYYISDNLRVDGRVVIYDGTAVTTDVRANSYIHMKPTFTNSVKNNGGTATQLPENYAITPTGTAGYGGSSTPTAVTNGTLKIINNTDFTPGSLYHLGLASGTWTTYNSVANDVGSTTTAVQVVKSTKVLTVRLKHTGLTHARINAAFTEVVLEGQTTAADYTSAESLAPIIIWLESSAVLNIKITGENSRRIIFAAGPGTGANLNLNFQSSSIVSGGPLRWRMNLVSEYRNTVFSLPTSVNLQMTGGIRTDWILNCTDTGTAVRIILQRETNPGTLESLLPRDGWMETYFLVR